MSRKTLLSRLLSEYQPRPGSHFDEKMERAPWRQAQHAARRPRLAWQIGAALALVLLLASLGIPSARAAISAWLGLSVAPSNQVPAGAVTLQPAFTPTPANTATTAPEQTAATLPATLPPGSLPGEVTQLSTQAGWDILYPARLPAGYAYQSAYLDTNHQMVILTFAATRSLPGDPGLTVTRMLTLLQARHNDFVPMQVAPAAALQDVEINGQPGVYAAGAWDSEFVPDASDPAGGKMVSNWRADLPIQNLYWQAGEVYLSLVTDDAALDRQALIDMAGSLAE